jgi:hypothetical protein
MAIDERKEGQDADATPGSGNLTGDGYEAEDVFEGAEPWHPIETKVVVGSFIAAAIALVVFGILIHIYILD